MAATDSSVIKEQGTRHTITHPGRTPSTLMMNENDIAGNSSQRYLGRVRQSLCLNKNFDQSPDPFIPQIAPVSFADLVQNGHVCEFRGNSKPDDAGIHALVAQIQGENAPQNEAEDKGK